MFFIFRMIDNYYENNNSNHLGYYEKAISRVEVYNIAPALFQ